VAERLSFLTCKAEKKSASINRIDLKGVPIALYESFRFDPSKSIQYMTSAALRTKSSPVSWFSMKSAKSARESFGIMESGFRGSPVR